MSTLEQELSAAFRAVADEAPGDLGLLSRVQTGVARRTRRRRLTSMLAAATAAAAAAATVTLLPGGHDSSLTYARDPNSFFTVNTAVPTFPFTPTYLPKDVTGEPDEVLVTPTASSVSWWSRGDLGLATSTARPRTDPPVTPALAHFQRAEVGVRGTTGTLSCAEAGWCRLTWFDRTGVWVLVDRQGERVADLRSAVRAVAEGLRTKTYQPYVHLRVGLVPRGCTFAEVAPAHLSLTGSPSTCAVTVALVPDLHYSGTPTTYGGRAALDAPSDHPGRRQVFVTYPGTGYAASVLVPASWDRALLDTFVRSITVRR